MLLKHSKKLKSRPELLKVLGEVRDNNRKLAWGLKVLFMISKGSRY